MPKSMSRKAKLVSAVLAVALIGGTGYILVERWQQGSRQNVCQSCWREIHPSMATVGEVDGKRQQFCCPACALTTAQQSGTPVRIVQLTDFNTKQPLDPKMAFLVRGSNINPDLHSQPLVDPQKQPHPVHYDRCTPSILAFQTRQQAETFQRENGGDILQISDLKPHLLVR